MEKCANCRRGPSGIEGHERLFSHTMNSQRMRFRCADCGAFWVRDYGEPGEFSWSAPGDEHPGMDVPGRPGTAPP